MTTDLELSADKILQYYQTRFQIEFLYRDGKQHTGLNDSQARSKNKLNFHFNMSLTAINIAKVTHWHIKQQYNEQGYLNYITAEISSPLGRSGGAWKAHIQRNARGQATAYEFTGGVRSEERRVGKECRCRRWPEHLKKKIVRYGCMIVVSHR